MYHKLLNILLVSDDAELENEIKKVNPLENFEHNLVRVQKAELSTELLQDKQLLILDIPQYEVKTVVRDYTDRNKEWDLCVVYCDRQGTLEAPGLLPLFDDIWTAPFTEGRVAFQFGRLLKSLKLKKDLWLSEHIFDEILDSVPDLAWVKDSQGLHTKVNNSFCKLVGKSKEDCHNKGHYYIWDIDPEEYAKGEYVCLESEKEVQEKGTTCSFDEKIMGTDGKFLQFKTYKTPLYDEDGTFIGICGVACNITDWNNMIRSQRVVLDIMKSPIVLADTTGIVQFVNKAWTEVFGKTENEIIGTEYLFWKNNTFELDTKRISEQMETSISYLAGEDVLDYELKEAPILDAFGQHLGYFCVFRDVTEHRNHVNMMQRFQKVLERDVAVKSRTIQDIQQKLYLAFANIIDTRDKQSGTHLRYTSHLVKALIAEMVREGRYPELVDKEYCEAIIKGALVHDIGMFVLPDSIVFKNGKYSDEEIQVMQQHTTIGKKMLDRTLAKLENFKDYKVAADMTLYHHERFDGTGYPKGLKGKEIPLSARIMAIIDTFASLISPRSYRITYTVHQAYSLMKSNAGAQFDMEIMAAFILARPQVEKIVNEMVYKIAKE